MALFCVDRSYERQPFPSHDAFPTTSPVPTCFSPVSTSQHAAQKGEKSTQAANNMQLVELWCYVLPWHHLLVMQQRAPGSQSGLKEEKLPPSPIMRGEPFNPAMRPEHQKHPDMKPSQPGHSQQSEDLVLPFCCFTSKNKKLFKILRLWLCWADVKTMDSSRPVIRSSEPSGPPPSLQDKEKFKQEPKTPTAPKKVQVSI